MGSYLNPTNVAFSEDIKDEIYVDKTSMIQFTNKIIDTRGKRIVVSRPRRFGKTMAINMLTAYYSLGCDSEALFRGLEIEQAPSFREHLNKHNVIRIDVYDVYSNAIDKNRLGDFRHFVSEKINAELGTIYPNEVQGNEGVLGDSLAAIYAAHGTRFIFLLDEWDVIYREEKMNDALKRDYTKLLRDLFKNNKVNDSISLVYMTGILPIPEQETQSGLNNFREFTMLNPGVLGKYFGFTQTEVNTLCKKWKMPIRSIQIWYDGYRFDASGSVYCPASVVDALQNQETTNNWTSSAAATELFEVMDSREPNFQRAVRDLLVGHSVWVGKEMKINFNDLKNINHAMIALVHLGYLAYHKTKGTVSIPNQEITEEFMNVLNSLEDNPTHEMVSRSMQLMKDTLSHNAEAVASAIQKNHSIFCSHTTYNRESDLAQLVIFSYYFAVSKDYRIFRELPAGEGFADIVFIPKKKDRIPIIVELKYKENVDSAITQIKNRSYTAPFEDCSQVLLVGISYQKDSDKKDYKKHTCVIELMNMD